MPSSLVFAALVLAWLAILVPMVARRRREVVRTADSALAARVLHRGGHDRREEVSMPEPSPADASMGDGPDTDLGVRRYRPGRGGFDPEAAELAARARYALRQRVVLGLLLTALATGVLAGFAVATLWWAHAAVDLVLIGYLSYLRRQVRIEQEIRRRRAMRAARARRAAGRSAAGACDVHAPAADARARQRPRPRSRPLPPELDGPLDESLDAPPQPAPRSFTRPTHPSATVVELDDEDPAFSELDTETPGGYRRAAGQ